MATQLEKVAALETFVERVAARPEDFFAPSAPLHAELRQSLKTTFDFATRHAVAAGARRGGGGGGGTSGLPLPELYIDGFDSEQIWGELDLQHAAVLGRLGPRIARLQSLADRVADDAGRAGAAPAGRPRAGRGSGAGDASTAGAAAASSTGDSSSTEASDIDADGGDDDDESDDDADADEVEDGESDGSPASDNADDADEAEDGADGADDMEAFLEEGDAALRRSEARKAAARGGDDSGSDDEDADVDGDDAFGDVDFGAPVPVDSDDDGDEGAAGAAAPAKAGGGTGGRAAALAALLAAGPRYEDFFGPRDGEGDDVEDGGAAAGVRRRRGAATRGAADGSDDDVDDVSDAEGDSSDGDGGDGGAGGDDDMARARRRVEAMDDSDGGGSDGGGDDDDEDDEDDEVGGGEGGAPGPSDDDEDGGSGGDDSDDDDDGGGEGGGVAAGGRRRTVTVTFGDDASNGDDSGSDDDLDGPGGAPLSRHARERAARAAQVAALEAAALAPKPWQLVGEVGAGARPANSLLEAVLDYEQAVASAPPVTVEATATLEDMIKRRIADGAWDDPPVYVPPAATATADGRGTSAAPTVSTAKAGEGLGEIYAREYEASALGVKAPDALAAAQAEAAALMAALFVKLDALSNFNFTPKPVVPELTVAPAVPAVALEEVLPTAVSDAAARAPEEVYGRCAGGRAGVLVSAGEQDGAARAAARRASKVSTRKGKHARDAVKAAVAAAAGRPPPPGAAGAPLSRAAAIAQLSRAHNVTIAPGADSGAGGSKRPREAGGGGAGTSSGGGGEKLTSSTNFFAKLQAEAQAKIGAAVAARDGAGAAPPPAKRSNRAAGLKL